METMKSESRTVLGSHRVFQVGIAGVEPRSHQLVAVEIDKPDALLAEVLTVARL